MRHLIFAAELMTELAIVGTVGSSWTEKMKDGNVKYTTLGNMSYGTYLDVYSKTSLIEN